MPLVHGIYMNDNKDDKSDSDSGDDDEDGMMVMVRTMAMMLECSHWQPNALNSSGVGHHAVFLELRQDHVLNSTSTHEKMKN